MCKEHPFHSLYHIYALKGSSAEADPNNSGSQVVSTSQAERLSAANNLFQQLRADRTTANRVQHIERLCLASVEWAKRTVPEERAGEHYDIPSGVEIRKIKNMPVPVMTSNLPIDHSLQYQNLCTIARFRSRFSLCGGKTKPKLTVCVGSDGTEYKQLVCYATPYTLSGIRFMLASLKGRTICVRMPSWNRFSR
jgi:serine-protein kinase ATM